MVRSCLRERRFMTHVDVPTSFTQPTGHVDLNNDGIGYIESYDFSTANLSAEHRIAAISTIASVCYQSPKALGSISLYDRLAAESAGLPSSSFEFVPVLLDQDNYNIVAGVIYSQFENSGDFTITEVVTKYGEWLNIEGVPYLLTNLRALMADVGDRADDFFNTPEECAIIAKHFKVYKAKIDLATRAQYIRHRVSWQELSRRYVSGKKSPFEFYISPKMKSIVTGIGCETYDCPGDSVSTRALTELCIEHYNQAIAAGVKPEEARRILPQSMYTTVWSAWQPSPLKSFYDLRLDKHAQSEIQELAAGMQSLNP